MIKKIKATIDNRDDLEELTEKLKQFFGEVGKVQVDAKKASSDKTQAQSNLYHMWCREIGDEIGYDLEEIKTIYKEKFMLNIFVDNDINDFQRIGNTMRLAKKKLDKIEYDIIRKNIIDSMSHVDLPLDLMAEYLNKIKLHASVELDIRLTEPSLRGLI